MTSYWERKLDRRGFLALLGTVGASGVLIACSGDKTNDTESEDGASVNVERPQSWVEATHGDVDPDFDTVFPANKVNQLKLTISAADWQSMLDDMTALFGARGTGGGFGGQPQGGQFQPGQAPQNGAAPGPMQQGRGSGGQPQGGQFQPGQAPQDGAAPGPMQQGPGGGGGGGMGVANTKKPKWVAGDVSFNGETWTKVGIRFKGNSSLRSSWGTGNDRMPFKLDFDEWEDTFPEVNNQRFYGFKQLSLSNNVGDPTHMRETLAYDVFEAAGLPAANTAFYEIIIDRGEGETSLGIYTVIEVVDDTMLDRVFGEDKGNIYEAEGSAASLAAGVAANLKNSFQKENNEDAADWSDVEKFHAILHSDKRTTDISAWRKELEAVFDVPVFLEWLALATTLQHWDTYGGMSHNYYLYNYAGKLTWISWDHNFILGAMGGGGQNPNGAMPNAGNNVMRQGGLNRNTSFDKAEVTAAQWPLIRYLMDVPDYFEAYKGYLKSGIEGPFNASKMQTRYEAWAKLLEPYAEQQGTSPAFQAAVQSLIQTTKDRNEAVTAFLAG